MLEHATIKFEWLENTDIPFTVSWRFYLGPLSLARLDNSLSSNGLWRATFHSNIALMRTKLSYDNIVDPDLEQAKDLVEEAVTQFLALSRKNYVAILQGKKK